MILRTLACLLAMTLLPAALVAAPGPPKILAPAGILIDAASGEVLWEREADAPRPVASTTKIMTALLAIEHGDLESVVTVSPSAAEVPEASLHLKPGETMTLEHLLYGVMLRSANDACVAVAEHVSGGVAEFVELMNARAAELGCANTRFVNPNGLHAPEHVSTPRDLALITRAALDHPEFRAIARAPVYTVERSKNRYDRFLKSRYFSFLRTYPGADGVKTGYTRQAGHCFVGSATRDGFQLVSVLLHSPSVRVETAALLDWGFKYYRGGAAVRAGEPVGRVAVRGGSSKSVAVQAVGTVPVTVRRDAAPVRPDLSRLTVTAPVKPGAKLGMVPLVSGAETVGEAEVAASEGVGYSALRLVGRGMAGAMFLFVGVAVGAIAQDTRRRRNRLAARRRGVDPRRPRPRERRNGGDRPVRRPRR